MCGVVKLVSSVEKVLVRDPCPSRSSTAMHHLLSRPAKLRISDNSNRINVKEEKQAVETRGLALSARLLPAVGASSFAEEGKSSRDIQIREVLPSELSS